MSTSKKEEPHDPHAKLRRVFTLFRMLHDGKSTVKSLAEQLDLSERTVRRYIEVFDLVGYPVEVASNDRHFISQPTDFKDAEKFTAEEANAMWKAALGIPEPLRSSILQKLALLCDPENVPDITIRTHVADIIESLSAAIIDKRRVIIEQYHSGNSGDIRDRLVEPIHFTSDYKMIVALEVKTLICKLYKIDRIGGIKIMRSHFKREALHERKEIDIFGMSGKLIDSVTLFMTSFAFLLLKEEFPAAIPQVQQIEEFYFFTTPVCSYKGIGRFVLGLMEEIIVLESKGFIDYLKGQIDSNVLFMAVE